MSDLKPRDVKLLVGLVLLNLQLTGPGRGGRAKLRCGSCRQSYELNGEQWRGIIEFRGGTKQWELQAMWNIPHLKMCDVTKGITILLERR